MIHHGIHVPRNFIDERDELARFEDDGGALEPEQWRVQCWMTFDALVISGGAVIIE